MCQVHGEGQVDAAACSDSKALPFKDLSCIGEGAGRRAGPPSWYRLPPQGAAPISDPSHAVTLPETGLTALFGIADENLRAIEDAFGVRLQARGSEISVVGGEAAAQDAARRLLTGLSDLLAGGLSPAGQRRGDGDPGRPGGPDGLARGVLHGQPVRADPQVGRHGPQHQAAPLRPDDRPARPRLRDRPGRHRQDLPRRGDGGGGAAREEGQADRPRASGRRGRGAARAFCRATSSRRSTRTCVRSTTPSTTSWATRRRPSCSSGESSRWRRSPSCAAAP